MHQALWPLQALSRHGRVVYVQHEMWVLRPLGLKDYERSRGELDQIQPFLSDLKLALTFVLFSSLEEAIRRGKMVAFGPVAGLIQSYIASATIRKTV